MTTNIRIVSATDLSVDNKVINLAGTLLTEGRTLAGVSWTVEERSAHEALLSVLKFVYGLIEKELPDYKMWLFVGNSAWQPDTRIVRHRKLWGALAARGIKVYHSCDSQEVMCEVEGKLKFFGATRLSAFSIESVVDVMLDERCSYLAVLPKVIELRDVISIGWSGSFSDDFHFLSRLIEEGGIIKRFGEFDDIEKGIVAIGRLNFLNHLLKK